MVKLNPATREILQIFRKFNFQSLTLKDLSRFLKKSEETIDQHIRRNKDIFEWNGKPKVIWVEQNIAEVVFFLNKNYCVRCRNHFPDEELNVVPISSDVDDFDHYMNLAPVCDTCMEVIEEPSELETQSVPPPLKIYSGQRWGYKRVKIKDFIIQTPNVLESTHYYAFQEDADDMGVWKHLERDNIESIIETSIQDILNHFGSQGWECVQYIVPEMPDSEEDEYGYPDEFEPPPIIVIFKRAI